MFAGFNVIIDDYSCIFIDNEDYYYKVGKKLYNEHRKCTLENLEQVIEQDIVDGDKLQNMWFPTEIFDANEGFIFISHSHQDEKLAITLAGYLYEEFNILSFIDSCVWRHMDKLNKILNNCDKGEKKECHHCECDTFSRNLSYVHMMLASALSTMIDKCECVFFLNTPSSININDKTQSPWIYYELNIASIIRKESKLPKPIMESCMDFVKFIEFTANIEDMTEIDEDTFLSWEEKRDSCDNSYEALYKVCGESNYVQ